MLRPGALAGLSVMVASAEPGGPLGAAVAGAAAEAGAEVGALAVDPFGDEPEAPPAAVLVWDGDAAFGEPSVASVHAVLDGAWLAVHAAATAALLERGGKVVLLAPRPGGPHREAARAGLENLARTLGIEWARFGVRTVAVLPGAATDPAHVGDLVAYLASRAGDYFSGCRIEMGGDERMN